MNAAEHYAKAEALTAKAEQFLDAADKAIFPGDAERLLVKAFYADAIARTHIHLAELVAGSRSIAAAQAEAGEGGSRTRSTRPSPDRPTAAGAGTATTARPPATDTRRRPRRCGSRRSTKTRHDRATAWLPRPRRGNP